MRTANVPILAVALAAVVVGKVKLGTDGDNPQEEPSKKEAREQVLTDREGKTLRAKVHSVHETTVRLTRIADGKEFDVPIGRFMDRDQAWLRKTFAESGKPEPTVRYEDINEMFGQALLADASLWDDPPKMVAQRLGRWPQESITTQSEDYRSYPAADYKVLGAHPYSAALYGANGRVSRLSLVYANQGDLFDFRQFRGADAADLTEEARRRLKDAVEADEAAIRKALTMVLGKGLKVTYGKGASRRRVVRWDWQGHSFILDVYEDICVNLIMESARRADRRGKLEKFADSIIRKKNLASVVRRPSGDVVLTNIPMVNQGPKGYCVPATFERAMRFMGIQTDMYLLANIGGSQLGGGTFPKQLLKMVGRDVKRAGRSYQEFAKKLRMSMVARSIDDGVPLMWRMHATPAFNRLARDRRDPSADPEPEIAAVEALATTKDPSDYAHLTLIVGYNKKTNEIAISHSWGQRYAERWVPIEEAAKVSQDYFYVIGH